jgi:hypothetical protein
MPIFNQPSSGTGTEEQERKLAAQRLSQTDLLPWFLNLAAEGPLPWNGVTASAALNWVSGGLSFTTGATAGSVARLLLLADSLGAFGKIVRSGANWAISARFAVTTAITAQTNAWVGCENNAGTNALAMGVVGATSTTNFVLKGLTGTPINSGVAIDTTMRTHRAWRVGTTVAYSVDNTIVTGNADINADVMPYAICQNGTDAVNRAMTVIWMAIFAPSL